MLPTNTKHPPLLRTLSDTAAASALLAACVLLILYRSDAQNGVFTGVYTCLNMLVPSLFPFVLLSCLLTRSRAASLLFRPLSPVMRHVFRLPACAAPALLFGLTAGYPVGAKITASLYADGRLNREQSARLLCFCTAPGYAFSLYAGTQLTGSPHTGVLLFLACLASPLVIGLMLSRFAPKPEKQPEASPPSGSFTDAVRDGVSAMVSMCGFVVVFSTVLSLLQGSGLFRTVTALLARFGMTIPGAGAALTFFLEVTSGISHCAYWQLSSATAAFGLGFAGICIHLQLFSFFREHGFPLRKSVYLLTRFLNGFLSAAAYTVLSFFFPNSAEAAVSGTPLPAAASGNPALSAALLALSLFFLLFCTQKNRPDKRTGRL